VAESEFLFALELSDEASFERMLTEIADAVFLHLGLGRPVVDALVGDVGQALKAGGGDRRCEVRFVVGAGQLDVVVTHSGVPEWRTRRPLPGS
jgi:hypothetical protein